MQALTPTITSELFGLHHFANNYAFINTMFIVGSFGLAKGVTSWSNEVMKSKNASSCKGQLCFGLAFWICAVVALMAAAASALLTLRCRGFYKRMAKCASCACISLHGVLCAVLQGRDACAAVLEGVNRVREMRSMHACIRRSPSGDPPIHASSEH